jgi:hypothetical protein
VETVCQNIKIWSMIQFGKEKSIRGKIIESKKCLEKKKRIGQ